MKIKFTDVCFSYHAMTKIDRPALTNINLEINKSERIGIIGPSGSGKTTLIQMFTGLLKPTSGTIEIDDVNIHHKNYNFVLLRQKIGVVFQFPESQLFEETVFDDVAFALKNKGVPATELNMLVQNALSMVGLENERILFNSPYRLSEGQKRKVAIAGILAMVPEVLILDEPTACLDSAGIITIEKMIDNLANVGKSIIIVSHNLEFIARTCDRVIVIANGVVKYDGPKDELFGNTPMFDNLSLPLPRSLRLFRKLYQMGYVSKVNIYSNENLIQEISDKKLINR
jgi:energy-coupling factor transporter ATPase